MKTSNVTIQNAGRAATRFLGFSALVVAMLLLVRATTGNWPVWWWFGLIALMLAGELLCVGFEKSSIRTLFFEGGPSSNLDFLYTAAALSGVMPFVITALSLGLTGVWQDLLTAQLGKPINLNIPLAAEIALAFVSSALAQYGAHRLMHSAWLWPLHALHHSARRMTIFNAGRTHPVDFAVHGIFYAIPGVLLGFSEQAQTIIPVMAGVIAFWQHSNLPAAAPWVEKWIVAGAANHAVHHAREARYHDRNFCDFPLFDRLFGTFAWSESPVAIGIEDDARYHLGPALLEPIRTELYWLQAVYRKLRGLLMPRPEITD